MSCHTVERFLVGSVVRNHDVDGLFPDDHIGRDVQCVADLQDQPPVLDAIAPARLPGSLAEPFVPGIREAECRAGPAAPLANDDLLRR